MWMTSFDTLYNIFFCFPLCSEYLLIVDDRQYLSNNTCVIFYTQKSYLWASLQLQNLCLDRDFQVICFLQKIYYTRTSTNIFFKVGKNMPTIWSRHSKRELLPKFLLSYSNRVNILYLKSKSVICKLSLFLTLQFEVWIWAEMWCSEMFEVRSCCYVTRLVLEHTVWYSQTVWFFVMFEVQVWAKMWCS